MKQWLLAFIALAVLAPGAPCLELSGGVRGGAGGSLFYGGWVDRLREELEDLGATTVRDRMYVSWRGGCWVEVLVPDAPILRVEADVGPVGGSLLASDGCDLLVGITGIDLALQVLAVHRFELPVGEIMIGSGIFVGGALPIREIRNDGVIRSEGELASVLVRAGLACGAGFALPAGPGAFTVDARVLVGFVSGSSPRLEGMLNAATFALTAGWEFRPRGSR